MSVEKLAALGSPTSVLTSELNSLPGASGISSLGPAYDNSSVRDRFGIFELILKFVNPPTAGGLVHLFCVPSLDGTNYADINGTPQKQYYVQSIEIISDNTLLHYTGEFFQLLPTKMKFLLINEASEDFDVSGNIAKLYTTNRTF